jgi:hypothetical protein
MRHIVSACLLALLLLPASALAHGEAAETPGLAEAVGQNAERLPNGLFRITTDDGAVLYSHGGDAKPAIDQGSSMDAGDPKLAVACASTNAQYVLYGRQNRGKDRLGEVAQSLRDQMERNTWLLDQSAKASGGAGARYRVACTGTTINIGTFTVKSNSTDFNTVVNAARRAGFNSSSYDYTIFYDAIDRNACGVGSFYTDERASASNYNNSGGAYAVSYRDCWYGRTSMHENGHNQGAVQASAPFSTGSGAHCNEVQDVMCYSPDGGNLLQTGTVTHCPDYIWFDCGFDTYFDASTEGSEWLSTHWNIGATYNRFITFP